MPIFRILHLVGSPVSSFNCELSELYARGCLEALHNPDRYEFIIAYVTPDQRWRFPLSLNSVDIAAAPPMNTLGAIQFLSRQDIDAALPQMFCPTGMTTYRALLEILDIPYIGNGPLQMAVTADKAKAKAIVAAAGVAVPNGEVITAGAQPSIALPAVVKPNNADNSEGVSLVKTQTAYAAALEVAFACTDQVLVEEFIELGREVRCGVIAQNGQLKCLPLEEYLVEPKLKPIRVKADKLKRDSYDALTLAAKGNAHAWIAEIDDPIVADVWQAAKRCYTALGCEQYGLFDFRIDPQGRPWFIEAGLYCSFSPHSVLVTMAKAAGLSLSSFFNLAVMQVVKPRSDKNLRQDGQTKVQQQTADDAVLTQ